jgi:hypothetical protein
MGSIPGIATGGCTNLGKYYKTSEYMHKVWNSTGKLAILMKFHIKKLA